MATWLVLDNANPVYKNEGALALRSIFSFHAKNSMAALNKIRKWCRKNNKEYGNDIRISLMCDEDFETDHLHNEYLE